MSILRHLDIHALRFTLVIIFAIFGGSKFFEFEVRGLVPLISITYLNFLYELFGHHVTSYILGVVELTACIGLFLGAFWARAGVIGSVCAILTGLGTLSLMPQSGFSLFILKDLLLVAGGMVIFRHDFLRARVSCPLYKRAKS